MARDQWKWVPRYGEARVSVEEVAGPMVSMVVSHDTLEYEAKILGAMKDRPTAMSDETSITA